MNIERLELLKSKLQQFEAEYSDTNGSPGFYIDKDSVIDACRVIKNDLGFRSCVDAISVDRFSKKLRFEMIYNLVSIEHNERIFVKVRLDTKSPAMQSLSLRRMYMPEAYEYHPLRKDFPLMGIPDSIPLPNK